MVFDTLFGMRAMFVATSLLFTVVRFTLVCDNAGFVLTLRFQGFFCSTLANEFDIDLYIGDGTTLASILGSILEVLHC